MSAGHTFRIAIATAAVALATAVAILLNLALLGYAQPRNDPVGKLSPRARLQPSPATTPTRPAVVTTGEVDD